MEISLFVLFMSHRYNIKPSARKNLEALLSFLKKKMHI
uniref:OmpA-like domain-containing protein n=1 Tax=Arundo donax TaxID=35708 RepID=A0A0A8YX83_ARUDO